MVARKRRFDQTADISAHFNSQPYQRLGSQKLILLVYRGASAFSVGHALQWNWRTRPDQFPFPELGPELWRDRLQQCVDVLAHLIARIGTGDD